MGAGASLLSILPMRPSALVHCCWRLTYSPGRRAMASPDKSARLDVRQLLDTSTVQGAAEPSLAADEVAPGRSLLLHFSITLESGELIDSNFDAAPAQCSLGDGKLLPGF